MLINIISLERRVDRKMALVDHLYDMGCTYKFWEGVDNRTALAYRNIVKSHQQVVQYAKDKKLPKILIAEDDLRFSSSNSLKYYLSNIPDEFHIYFGMIYSGNIQDGRITHGFTGLQFYLINENFYDIFLSAPDTQHLDVWLGEQCHKYLFHCCDPFICYGESGYSDNFKRRWVFDESKLPRNLYRSEI